MHARFFVEPVNRHHREQLLDGPAVGNRLEEREVAEVGVRQLFVERLQILRHFFERRDDAPEFEENRPEQVLGQAALLERQVAGVEQAERHVHRLLGIMEGFQRVP